MLKLSLNRIKKNINLTIILLIVSCIVNVVIIYKIKDNSIMKIDRCFINYFDLIRDKRLDKIMIFITSCGNFNSVFIVSIFIVIAFFVVRRIADGIYFGISITGVWVFNELLKIMFKRPRPVGLHLVNASGYSFPSGHAMIFSALCFTLIYYINIHIKSVELKVVVIGSILLFATLVGVSRIYVNVHYFSDVLAGLCFSNIWVLVSLYVYNGLKKKTN